MKEGILTLNALAQEVDRQKKAKRDFVLNTKLVEMVVGDAGKPVVKLEDLGNFGCNDVFHEQVAEKLKIPRKYYDLMLEKAPDLLVNNVNHWFKKNAEMRFLRTLDGNARALLSERYRPIDNAVIMEAAMLALKDSNMELASSKITDKHFYLKVTFPDMEMSIDKVYKDLIGKEIKELEKRFPGERGFFEAETLRPGLVISNSEVGCGAVNVESLIYTIRCRNGAIFSGSLRKYHVGKGLGGDDDSVREFFSNDTKRADDKAFIMKVHDVVKAACDQNLFAKNVEKIAEASTREIEGNVAEAVERVVEKYSLTETDQSGILNHLIKGGNINQWGLSSAITRYSQDVPDYEKATDLERLGGQIVELPSLDFRQLVGNN